MKALELLKTNQTVKERAEKFAASIKRDIQNEVIDSLIKKQEKMVDQLFELQNFTLGTDLNHGIKQMTQEECKERFKKIIDLEYSLVALGLEIKVKTDSFNTYFGSKTKTKK